jgi:hypothetical protein
LRPEQLLPPVERQPDRPETFPVPLAAYRQVVVERARPALVHLVARVRRAVVVLEHRAELVHPQPAVRSAVAAVVVLAAAAAEQTRSMQ